MGPAERPHPDRCELERFMSGGLDRCAARAVVRHLLAGCRQCAEVTRHFWLCGDRTPREPPPPPDPSAGGVPPRILGWRSP